MANKSRYSSVRAAERCRDRTRAGPCGSHSSSLGSLPCLYPRCSPRLGLCLWQKRSLAAPRASSLFSPSIHARCARNVRGEIPACCLRSLLTDLLPLKFSDPFLTLLLPPFLCLLQQQVPHFRFLLWKAELAFICLKRLSSRIHQVHVVPVLWDLVNDGSAFVVFTTSMVL